MPLRVHAIWLRALFLLSFLFSAQAWACAGSTSCVGPGNGGGSAFGSSSSSLPSSPQPSASSYSFSDSNPGAAVSSEASYPKLSAPIKADPSRGFVDFGKLSQESAAFRDIERKSVKHQRAMSPAAQQERQALNEGRLSAVASDDVIRPVSVQQNRGARGASRVRTIATGGE